MPSLVNTGLNPGPARIFSGSRGSGRVPCHPYSGQSVTGSCTSWVTQARGEAHAISRSLATAIHGLRSLEENLASPSWLREVFYAARSAWASPLAVHRWSGGDHTQGEPSTGSRGWKPEKPGDFAPGTPPSPSAPRRNIPATEAFTPGDPRRKSLEFTQHWHLACPQARGEAHAISTDARSGILPALARGKPRFAILAALGFPRRSIGMGLAPRSPSVFMR
jgi:hypothetical protein